MATQSPQFTALAPSIDLPSVEREVLTFWQTQDVFPRFHTMKGKHVINIGAMKLKSSEIATRAYLQLLSRTKRFLMRILAAPDWKRSTPIAVT